MSSLLQMQRQGRLLRQKECDLKTALEALRISERTHEQLKQLATKEQELQYTPSGWILSQGNVSLSTPVESLETHLAQHHASTVEAIIQQTMPVVQHMERPATTVESQIIFRQYADGGEVNLTRQ